MQGLFNEDGQSNEVPQITSGGSGQPMSIVNVHHDSSAAPTIVKLNGTNYSVWSQLLELHVAGKGKYGYLTGASAAPAMADSNYNKWREDQRRSTMMVPPTPVNTGVAMVARNSRPASSYKPADSTINGPTRHSMHASSYKPAGSTANGPIGSTRPNGPQRVKPQNGERCTHCNSTNHFVIDCFKLHGYPEWWDEVKERNKAKVAAERYAQGKVALCIGSPDPSVPQASPMPSVSSSTVPPGFAALPTGDSGTSSNTSGSAFAAVTGLGIGSGWIIDSGASNHMTFDSTNLKTRTTPSLTSMANANGQSYPVTGAGTVDLSPNLTLEHVLLVPSLSQNLLSVGQVTEQLNCFVLIYPLFCLLQDIRTQEIIGRGTKRGGLYYVDDVCTGKALIAHDSAADKKKQIWLWHWRLGHASFGYLKHLFPALFLDLDISSLQCETCILAKSHRVSYPISFNKNDKPFALIHSDDNGLLHETTCPYTPQQNGVAERKNRHILETARSILIEAHMPKMFWSDAILYAVYLLNRMPSSVHGYKTPLDVLTLTHPLPSVLTLHPRIFGCIAYVHILKHLRSKLDPCALKCVFVGFSPYSKGYRCYHPPTKRTYVTMDVTFSELSMYFHHESNSPLQGEKENIEEQNWNWTIMLPDITIEREEVICNDKENVVTLVEDLASHVDNPTLVPATPHIPHNCSPSSTPTVPVQIPEASDNPEVSTNQI
ncbi:unnamed protein product [Prunus brigantina]